MGSNRYDMFYDICKPCNNYLENLQVIFQSNKKILQINEILIPTFQNG